MPVLPLAEDAAYQTRQNKAKYDYDALTAANSYGRFVSQQRFDRSRQDLADQFIKARNSFDNPYIRRGMFYSGMRQQGLQDFEKNRIDQTNALEQDRNAALGQYDLTGAQSASSYQQALLDIERERQARIADLASQLATLKGGV